MERISCLLEQGIVGHRILCFVYLDLQEQVPFDQKSKIFALPPFQKEYPIDLLNSEKVHFHLPQYFELEIQWD